MPVDENGVIKPLPSWYVTGLFDGEGSFGLYCCTKNDGHIRVQIVAALTLRADQKSLIQRLQVTLPGYVSDCNYDERPGRHPLRRWEASSRRQVEQVVEHFEEYPLIGQKQKEFEIWRRAIVLYYGIMGDRRKFSKRPDWLLSAMKYYEQELKEAKKYAE